VKGLVEPGGEGSSHLRRKIQEVLKATGYALRYTKPRPSKALAGLVNGVLSGIGPITPN